MARPTLVLHSALTPNAVAEALRRSIDEEHSTLLSWSGYRGSRPLLGEVGDNTFRVQKRKCTRNDFAGQFYARFTAETGGTRIEGYFDAARWARYFMRIWLGFAVLVGTPLFLLSVIDITSVRHYTSGDRWVGVVVPPALIVFGTVLPRVGRLLGKANERFILEHIQSVIAARIE